MAERREDLRAADVDRQFVADRLKFALDEGRLSLTEYDERLRDAYGAKTYGDLDLILADLPGLVPEQQAQVATTAPAAHPSGGYQASMPDAAPGRSTGALGPLGPMPMWLAGIWTAWLIAVSVNVVIWLLVSVSSSDGPVYFWPMWVAGPWGAVLLATTLTGVLTGAPHREAERRARRSTQRRERHQRRQTRRRGVI